MRFKQICAWILLYAVILAPAPGLAAYPPTTTKGQLDATSSTTFNFVAPAYQITKTAATTGLIETGSDNLLKNPSFEATTFSDGWTKTGSGTWASSTPLGLGTKSLLWTPVGAGETIIGTAITVPESYKGKSGEFVCQVQVPSGANSAEMILWNGTSDFGTSGSFASIVAGSSGATEIRATFIYPASGTIAAKFTSGSSVDPVKIDGCRVGFVTNQIVNLANTPLPPTIARITASSTYNLAYGFYSVVPVSSIVVGSTYTHNGTTYTVVVSDSSTNWVILRGSAAPLSNGTLTFASGSGVAAVNFSLVRKPIYLRVTLVAGGGGGGAGTGGTSGGNGGSTTMNGITVPGGAGGHSAAGLPGGSLGAPTGGVAGYTEISAFGNNGATAPASIGGMGGPGWGGGQGRPGRAGVGDFGANSDPNTGAGGSGGATTNAGWGGGGGTAGAMYKGIIPKPAATYAVTIGLGGAAGTGAVSGVSGFNGASGVAIIEENWQ